MEQAPKPRLLDLVRRELRVRRYSYRTEQQYVAWIRRYIRFHGLRHPAEMGGPEVSAFLSHLATDRDVAAATQAQALAALLFLYRHVLSLDLPWMGDIVRARRPKKIPVVLTRAEVRRVLAELPGVYGLLGSVLYGAGLRLSEGLNLRVKDLDLARRALVVRDGKGAKDRVSVMPDRLCDGLRAHLVLVRAAHERAMALGFGGVALPGALSRKYPGAHLEWGWQFVFPAATASRDPQACFISCIAPQLRDSPAGVGRGYPHGPGAPGSRQREDDADLHACIEPGWVGGSQSAGFAGMTRLSRSLGCTPAKVSVRVRFRHGLPRLPQRLDMQLGGCCGKAHQRRASLRSFQTC